MIIFTTIEHLNGRGVPASLTRRFGKDYQVVLIDPSTVKDMRKKADCTINDIVLATVSGAVRAYLTRYGQNSAST